MTVIVGLVHRGTVYLGGDSAGVNEDDLTVRKDVKVARVGPFVIGFFGSYRAGQLVVHAFSPPPLPTRRADLDRYMVVDFVDGLRKAVRGAGVKDLWGLLVGINGRLFAIEDDLQVAESRDGFDAVGAGAAYARGALYATPKLRPRDRVLVALRAAERHSASVRGPFTLLSA